MEVHSGATAAAAGRGERRSASTSKMRSCGAEEGSSRSGPSARRGRALRAAMSCRGNAMRLAGMGSGAEISSKTGLWRKAISSSRA